MFTLLFHLMVWSLCFSLFFESDNYHGPTMLMPYAPRAMTIHEASSCKITHVNSSVNGTSIFPSLLWNPCSDALHNSSFSLKGRDQLETHHVSHHVASKRWLCRLHNSISEDDDEYLSSRHIAISLFKRYKMAVDRGGGDNLEESGVEIEAMQNYGGTISLKSKIISEEVDECILWLSIIFITILCTPQPTIVRWSATPSVSGEVRLQWKGFCAIIANAYFMRRMARLPVKTLQLEQMAVEGQAEEPSIVASRMRLVFTTLEVVSPQA
ncbi:hypothetical protein I3760_10G072300 [Carya illinoinensis]|nr:hypothetical protein I3760_10G072300 [Carya illinoinensis]